MDKEIVNKRHSPGLGPRLFTALTTLNLWHLLWISIVMSEVLTALMGLLLKGAVSYDYLITGGVVSLIVAGIVIFFLKVTMQVRLDNKILRAEVEKQRETAEDLSHALDFQALLMDTIPDLLYVLDPDGVLIKWNGKTEEATGYSGSELDGRHVLTFIAEEDRDDAQAALEEAYSKGIATRELHLLTKDGKTVVHLFSGAAIRDGGERFVGFIGIARDISKFKKMEEEMTRAQKLESAGILAGGIAHDFNYLLTSILENIHLAVINVDQRNILRETLLRAQKASVRAKDLTRQLLAFSRGGLPMKRLAALEDIVREYAGLATLNSSVGCDFNIAAGLWNAEVDEGQIGQVINTVVLNAIEAMPQGGTIVITADNIEVSAGDLPPLSEGGYVRFSISDSGIGMPKELLRKIFDPYFTTKQSGRGLGLTIAYTIIRNHDGHIQVESEPEKGTVFHIYLPACR